MQNHNWRVFQNSTSNRNPLFLSDRKFTASIANICMDSLWQILYKFGGVGNSQRFDDFVVCSVLLAYFYVVRNGSVKHNAVLCYQAELCAQRNQLNVFNIDIVNQNFTVF